MDQLLTKAIKCANRPNSVNLNDFDCRPFTQGIQLSVLTPFVFRIKTGAILTFH